MRRRANPMSKEFLGKHNLWAVSSVSTALDNLVAKDFILKEGAQYTIQDTLFMPVYSTTLISCSGKYFTDHIFHQYVSFTTRDRFFTLMGAGK